jgi:hypothetical protein
VRRVGDNVGQGDVPRPRTEAASSDARSLGIVAIVAALALIAIYASDVIFRESISPEIGMAYLTFASIKSLGQALTKFFSVHETWYRPLTFYVTNHLVFQVVDIHDIALIKTVSFCVIVVNGLVATALARRLFASGLVESTVTFSLIVTHPLYYTIAFDGSGIVDPIFTIFLNLFLIGYLTLLEASNVRLGYAVEMSPARSGLLCVLCGLMVVGTVTSHERGIAIFLMAGVLFVYYHWSTQQRKTVRWGVSEVGAILFCVVAFVAYMAFVYANKGNWTGQHYRTGIEFKYILPNLAKAIQLPIRMLLVESASVYDGHWTVEFNLYAVPFVACLVVYVVHVCRHAPAYEKNRLLVLTVLFLCSLPIPVLFGSSTWHFYTAAIYLCIATGRALWFCLQKMGGRFRGWLLIALFALLAIATVRGVDEELRVGSDYREYLSLVPRALREKVLNDISEVPEVVYYDTGDYGELTWPFGGQGNLFKYLYKDPSIIEIAVVHGKVLASDEHLCARAAGKRTLSFQFDVKRQSWSVSDAKPCQQ